MPACPSCATENPEGFRFCGACGAPIRTESVVARRKLATLLFCDMSGSTAAGERVDAESVRELMFRYFHTMREAVERHGGTIEKFIGDAVVAVFGVPVAHEDDALRAVRAASDMQARLEQLNDELERLYGTRIALRIGLNTGEVVAGDPTSRETFVTGDAVNVAARLEQAANPGEILFGEPTYRLVRDAVEVEPIEPLALKGKSEPVAAYRLLRVSAAAPARAPRLEAELVGRDDEVALLEDAFARAVREGRCVLATVLGEAGVGKSRLATELLDRVAGQATSLTGRCLPYGEGITFWPIAEIVRQAAGIRHEDAQDEAVARIASLFAGDGDGALVAERIAQAIGLAPGAAGVEEIAWAIRRLLEALARRRPLVVLVDDIHWAEPAMLDVLADLPMRVRGVAILVLCLSREELLEKRPEWEATARLERLGGPEFERLIEDVLGAPVAPEARERVAAAAQGNPLFGEELLAMLVDEGVLRRDEGTWVATQDLTQVAIPPTLSALLGSRLDRLASAERSTLERGSIEGELFHRGAVAALATPEERADVEAQLRILVGKEFVYPAPASFVGDAAFRFRHILVRDVTYQSAPKRLRAELHERFARWLERIVGDRVAGYEEIVGYHLEQAYRYRIELGPPDADAEALARRAGKRLAAAGRRASVRGDTRAAVNLLSRATDLLPIHDPSHLELLPELAAALFEAGEFARAGAVLDEAAESGTEPIASRASIHRRMLQSQTEPDFPIEEARSEVEATIAVFENHGDDQGLARAWLFLSELHNSMGHRGEMEATAARSAEHARKAGDHRTEAEALRNFGGALVYGSTPAPEAIARLEDMLASGVPNRMVEAALVAPLAALKAMGGQFAEARELVERARGIYSDLGLTFQLARLGFMSGRVERLAGGLEAAERELRKSFDLLGQMGETGRRAGMALDLASVQCDRGNFDEAEASLQLVEQIDSDMDILYRSLRARVLVSRGDPAGVSLAREALAQADPTDDLTWRAEAIRNLADVFLAGGDLAEAAPLLQEAIDLYEAKENVVAAHNTRVLLEELRARVS